MWSIAEKFNQHALKKGVCAAAVVVGIAGISSGLYSVANGDIGAGLIAGVLCGGVVAAAGYQGLRKLGENKPS